MKRKIIKIDSELCNGCGLCAQGCPEGAIQMVDGKARLVSALYCDGLGACIGECPVGAITIEEREAEAYDERKTMENIIRQGKSVVLAHLKHLKDHQQSEFLAQAVEVLKEKKMNDVIHEMDGQMQHSHGHGGGCPGSMAVDLTKGRGAQSAAVSSETDSGPSQLQQWPIEFKLLNPHAPYFKDAHLLIAADCVPFSFPNFHQRFLKGKKLAIFCPKLDNASEEYIEKLADIFSRSTIKSVTVVHMEVPCCFGTVHIVEEALKKSGKNTIMKEFTISINGNII